ncbi:MAG TPA: TA system VapC family ribonuclease toxin [Verrucomicrobiae bacterium]|nr:TA system VapC family ribonuclease toxin [Verrucomicrobiae bacterium]
MISFDTNLLLYSLNQDCPEHTAARAFFDSLPTTPGSVAISELVLVELYVLLRNPAVLAKPLSAPDAAVIIQAFRQHPRWTLLDAANAPEVMNSVWKIAARPDVGRRVIFDARLALTLKHHGVTEFATRNEAHFKVFAFDRVWNPLPT